MVQGGPRNKKMDTTRKISAQIIEQKNIYILKNIYHMRKQQTQKEDIPSNSDLHKLPWLR